MARKFLKLTFGPPETEIQNAVDNYASAVGALLDGAPATSEEIKTDIQNLTDAANTKTGKNDATLADAIDTLIEGYGQGGGSDVSVTGRRLFNSVITADDITLQEITSEDEVTQALETPPADSVVGDITIMAFGSPVTLTDCQMWCNRFKYEDTIMFTVSVSIDGQSEVIFANTSDDGVSINLLSGAIIDIKDAGQYTDWLLVNTTSLPTLITENGEYDVTDVEKVSVDVPNKCAFGKWVLGSAIPTNLPNTSVNFIATFNGELKKYVGIEFDNADIQFWYVKEDGSKDLPYDLGNWLYEESHIIDFGSTPQTVSEKFIPFLSDATPAYDLINEVLTEDEMTALLETAEVGAIYRYTGETTDTYEKDGLYVVKEENENKIFKKLINDILVYDGTITIV